MLYEITTFGTYYNQEVINRWNYVSSPIPPATLGSLGLAFMFGAIPVAGVLDTTKALGYIMGQLSASVLLHSVTVRAAAEYDVTDFYEVAYTTPMTGSQDAALSLSPTSAYGFRTNRVRLDVARGTKRFAGVTSDRVDAGGVIAATFADELQGIAVRMSSELVWTVPDPAVTYTPCVVSKLKYVTPKGKDAYKYYPTLAEQLLHTAVGVEWQPYNNTRTQDSRQYGKGS